MAEAGKPVQENVSLVVVDERIHDVLDGVVESDSLSDFDRIETIDLRDKFVMPGLIDAHVHLLSLHRSELPDPNKERGFANDAELALNGAFNAKKTLDAGFTTVRDLGAPGSVIFSLRDAIAAGRIAGPRILAAGRAIAVTAGHADDTGPNERRWQNAANDAICDGVDDCRRAVRSQVKRSADVIKITVTGGGGKPQGGPDAEPEFFPDEFKAAVDTAHRLDKKVAVHAHGTKGIKLALEAGVDSIEHSTFLDDKTIALFDRNKQFMVPTLSVRDNLIADIDEMPPHIQDRARYIVEITPTLMGRAHKKGVKFANGSDAGVVPHGDNVRELEWLVKIGMTPPEALYAATINAAQLLGLEAEVGVLTKGAYADIIAVPGDPTTSVSDLRKVEFVMASGRVHRATAE